MFRFERAIGNRYRSVYTATYSATDLRNESQGIAEIKVPHDQDTGTETATQAIWRSRKGKGKGRATDTKWNGNGHH
jgi:hypothetical protein